MGNFLSSVSADLEALAKTEKGCWSETLAQVREYHGYFKYVCDSLIISKEECKEIFGNLEKWEKWDPEGVGKIDALEIFCGLIVFARESTFKQKLSFLFSIFDFNEIKSLSFIDVEVMILSLCNSVYKILGSNARTSENDIAEWLSDYLPHRDRIKITTLYYFCLRNPEIKTFFKLIDLHTENDEFKLEREGKDEQNALEYLQMGESETSMSESLEWHKSLLMKMERVKETEEEQGKFGCNVSWVYGINTSGRSKPFMALPNNQILYRVSSFAVLYNLETSSQRLIEGHRAEVDCIAYNYSQDILATVQRRPFPPINIWCQQEGEYLLQKTINNNHQNGVSIMQFILRERFLVTVDKRADSPILIYNFEEGVVVHHIIMNDDILDVFDPFLLLDSHLVEPAVHNYFYAVSATKSTVYEIEFVSGRHVVRNYSYCDEDVTDPITAACACYLNISSPSLLSYRDKSTGIAILTGHASGTVRMLSNNPKYNERYIVSHAGAITCIRITEEVLAFCANESIYIYQLQAINADANTKLEPILQIDLPSYEAELRLLTYNISYFDFIDNYIIAVTTNGDFLTLHPHEVSKPQHEVSKHDESPDSECLRVNRIDKISRFEGKTCTFCIFECKEGQELILFVTNENKIIGIDSQTHEVHDIWEISNAEVITHIDAMCSDEGSCHVVCASKGGKLYIRIDWEESPKYHECGSEIMDVKLSRDCSYLLVATAAHSLLFFTQTNKNFTSPRKLLFQNEIPMSIAFLDNFRYFLVITSAANTYQIEIPQLKHRLVQKETETICASQMNIKYPCSQPTSKQLLYSCSSLGATMKFSLVSSHSGLIYFFGNPEALINCSYSILSAHKCSLNSLVVNSSQSRFYSLGSRDNTLIEWTIFECKKAHQSEGANRKGQLRMCQATSLQSKTNKMVDQFDSMEHFAINELMDFLSPEQQQSQDSFQNSSFFFKGTRNQRLNEALELYGLKEWSTMSQYIKKKGGASQEDMSTFLKRAPNISLQTASVYGADTHRRACARYDVTGQYVLTTVSRFIIKTNLKTKQQIIFEPTNRRITYLACHPDGDIFYSVVGRPEIYIMHKKVLMTSHSKGVLHFNIWNELVLSFGTSSSGHSINVHNHTTSQLIHHSCTNDRISEFIIVSRNLVVSLPQLRVWRDYYPSPAVCTVTAGCLLPNRDDLLLAVGEGELAIFNARKGFWQSLGIRAHEKPIDHITTKELHTSEDSFDVITIGQDEKLKIWSSTFECKMMINFREKGNLSFSGEGSNKLELNSTIIVKAVDSIEDRILLMMHTGQLAEVEFKLNKPVYRSNDSDRQDNPTFHNFPPISQKSNNDLEASDASEKSVAEMTYEWTNLLSFHSSRCKDTLSRRTFFSVNEVYPLLATSSSDNQIIIHNHEINIQVCQCYFEGVNVDCVKFSPSGCLIALGFSNGEVRFYELKMLKNEEDAIVSVALKLYQTFGPKNPFGDSKATTPYLYEELTKTQIVNMEFSKCGTYFVVSYFSRYESSGKSFIQIYKTRQPASVEPAVMNPSQDAIEPETQIQYYFQCDYQVLGEENKASSQKFLRSVYFMSFLEEEMKINSALGMNKQHRSMKSSSSLAYQSDKFEKGPLHLVLYEQFVSENLMRVNGDNKVKVRVYNLQEKSFTKEEYCVNFLKWKFPHFVNGRSRNNSPNWHSPKPQSDHRGGKPFFCNDEDKKLQDKFNQELVESDLIVSDMIFYGNEAVFYGDSSGKIHIVKYSNFFDHNTEQASSEDIHRPKSGKGRAGNDQEISQMNLARSYVSHTSFISQMELSGNREYLFVNGAIDDCVVKYRLMAEEDGYDIDSFCYPIEVEDPHEEYMNKQKFQDFLNNIEPIRGEISEIMMDVEPTPANSKASLELMKVFGRRAFDRRSNLYHDGLNNLIYTLGPNIILQDDANPTKQQVIPVDPDEYSTSPQISCISFQNSQLIAATEEQFSRIFVWDIYSLTCLSQFKLRNFSIVYHIAQSDKHRVFLAYGVNSLFEASMQLVNWETGMVMGNYSLMHSGCWKIKDICQFQQLNNGLEFISCGTQHLALWEYKAGVLVSESFDLNAKASETTFMTVRASDSIVITGCESGVIYLWSNFQLCYELPLHSAGIHSLVVCGDLIFSAGMDSTVHLTQIIHEESELALKAKQEFQINFKGTDERLYLAEKDIQALAITEGLTKIYAGTRSGSIYYATRNLEKIMEEDGEMVGENGDICHFECMMSAHDNDTIAHIAFDQVEEDLFYMLTVSGIIEVWSISRMERRASFKLSQQACKVFCLEEGLLISCEKSIYVVSLDLEKQKLSFHSGLSRQFEGVITDCVISRRNQSGSYFFSVGIRKSEFNEIIIHEIGKSIVEKFVVVNLKYEIEFLDFSRDSRYLLFKDSFEELGMVNLQTYKRINTIFVEMGVEWEAEGLRISPHGQRIYCAYSRDNKITNVRRLGSSHIIIGDEMGTLRIFEYPCPEDRLGELHTGCYSAHMNFIKNIAIHPTQPYVLSSAVYDRSVILWKVAGIEWKAPSTKYSDI